MRKINNLYTNINNMFSFFHNIYKKKDPEIYQLFIRVSASKYCSVCLSPQIINTLFYIWYERIGFKKNYYF